jgi:uncharacterized integral membrane protein
VKKLGFILVAIAAIVIGLLVGTLNADSVQLDLLWVQFDLPLGLAILIGFSAGVILGLGAIYIARVLPLRHQLRKARTALAKQDSTDISLPND